MVERPRRRFLPFDPWHLFLAPLAAVMLLPLLWMVVTSLETGRRRALPADPLARARSSSANYPDACAAPRSARGSGTRRS